MNSVTRYIDALLKELINKAAKGVAHILLLIFICQVEISDGMKCHIHCCEFNNLIP